MRLIVTRPEPDASETAGRLRALGHSVQVAPMMWIEWAPQPTGLVAPAAIALTSRNAVRALADWPSAQGWRRLPVYAVGEATAALARAGGFGDVRVGDGDAAGLVRLVRADFDKTAGAILHPAGRDRSADLAQMLAGFTVTTVEAYRAVAVPALDPATVEAIASSAVDGVLFFSRRTAAIFADLVEAAGIAKGLAGTTLFALSQAVAAPLVRLRSAAIKTAARADEDSLMATIGRG